MKEVHYQYQRGEGKIGQGGVGVLEFEEEAIINMESQMHTNI